MDVVMETRNLCKSFGSLAANENISFELRRGEIHCLLGENGAGKTTLSKCLYGFLQPDIGDIYVNGKKVKISSPKDGIKYGIGMVTQHFELIKPLSALENIVVGTKAVGFLLDTESPAKVVHELCANYGITVDLKAKVWQMSLGEQQWVEILKALYLGAKILILDEPTAVLTPQEREKLFAILNKMKSDGLSILFITHKLGEVVEISERVTILRKGKNIGTYETKNISKEKIANLMVGRDVLFRVNKEPASPGKVVLSVEELRARNDRGLEALRGLSLQIHEREILGVAGVSGNGQKELLETIVGVREVRGGRIFLNGRNISGENPRQTALQGLSHIPSDRVEEGLALDFTIAENLVLGLNRSRPFKAKGLLNSKEIDKFAWKALQDFNIKADSPAQLTKFLSGGNLQKVILARELSQNPV